MNELASRPASSMSSSSSVSSELESRSSSSTIISPRSVEGSAMGGRCASGMVDGLGTMRVELPGQR